MPTLPQPPPGQHLKRAEQRIGCEHPTAIAITALSDPSEMYLCNACGARWCGERR